MLKLRQVPGVRKIALQLSVPHFLYAVGIQWPLIVHSNHPSLI